MKYRHCALVATISAVFVLGGPVSAPAQTCPAPQSSFTVVAKDNAFDADCYAAPADTKFTITFDNQDPFSHNLSIYEQKGGRILFEGAYVSKQSKTEYAVPALPAGSHYFMCDIHPFMNGTFLVGDASGAAGSPSPTEDTSRAPAGPAVRLEPVAAGFTAPVFITGAGDGSGRLFIVDQIGVIKIVSRAGDVLATPFLDVRDKIVKQKPDYDERGLLGLAFSPKFATDKTFYVYYSAPLREGAPAGWDHTSHISEFKVSADDPNVADASTERIVFMIDKPQANHNSGHIAFGPDGMLYIPIGDGGNANDVGLGHPAGGNAQNKTTILGNILRIDPRPSAGASYTVPRDNPYADGANGIRPEIWASGFRNPYHISFDAGGDHALYAADAGQDRYEEVDRVTRGANYGWNIREGLHCFSPKSPAIAPTTCPSTSAGGDPLVEPVLEYNHAEILGSVIIGGYVYRGRDVPAFKGRYVFGDYSRDRLKPDGTIFAAKATADGPWDLREVVVTIADDPDPGPGFGRFVLSFGQDDDHELYVALTGRGGPEGASGAVYRFAAADRADGANAGTKDGTWFAWVAAGIGIALLLGFGIAALAKRKHT